MFLIERFWTDSMTSIHEPDHGYKVECVVSTEELAKKVVAEAGLQGWFGKTYPSKRYRPIALIEA